MKKLISHIKKRLISGLLILVPLLITYFIVKFIFNSVDNLFATHINRLIQKYFTDFTAIPGIGIVVSVFIIYVIGMLGSSVIITKMINLGEKMLTKIPLIKPIYSAVKQLVDALSVSSASSFRRAVYVEYPKAGVYALGFLTNEFKDAAGNDFCSVFLPTTPNPTSGYILFYPKKDVVSSVKSVDEAFKAIMSGAIVFEGDLPVNKPKTVAQNEFETSNPPESVD